jgi:rod shape-determining protein MreC
MAPPRNPRPGFSRRAQYGLFLGYVVAIVGGLVAIALLLVSAVRPDAFAPLRSGMAEVTTPISSGLAWVRRSVLDLPGGVGGYFGVVEENRRLRARLAAERSVVLRSRTLARENARLRRLLALREVDGAVVVTARLVSSTASSTRRFATLNAGYLQGVRTGQPVRGPEGLIGRVLEMGPNTARVLLISDPDSIVPVRRTRDGMPAIASGRGDGKIDIRSAGAANAPYRAGDSFVTSGAGGLYPPDVPVARVNAPSRDIALGDAYADPDVLDFAIVQRAFLPAPPRPPAPAGVRR